MSETPSVDDAHARPDGATDEEIEASGKVSEYLEYVERARGHLYSFHQLSGHADLLLDEAVEVLRSAGHDDEADRITEELIGLNVIAGRWTFQLVEEYDDGYYAAARSTEERIRERLAGGRRHVFEAEMKEQRRTHGRRGHAAHP